MGQPDESPQVKIAVLNNDIKHINDTLARMETKFDAAIGGFVTIDKLVDSQKAADEKHAEILDRIIHLEAWNTWAIRIVLAGIISGIVYVVTNNQHLFH